MFEEAKKYAALNRLAKRHSTVILGGSEDKDIPLCELKETFEIETELYNRSVSALSVKDAVQVYDAYVAPLHPEAVLLHIGAADEQLFAKDPALFDQNYRALLTHIKRLDDKCKIAVITIKERQDAPHIVRLNRHLQAIAQGERCEFFDVNVKRVWNPKGTKDALAFVYALGLVRKNIRPLYDIIKILFCYDATAAE